MKFFTKRWQIVLFVFLTSFAFVSTGCDKLKKLTKFAESKPKVIKAPKIVIKITKLSKAVRIVGGHKALMIKAVKQVKGYRDASVDWKKKIVTVGIKNEDVDTGKFVDSLKDYGYGAVLQEDD